LQAANSWFQQAMRENPDDVATRVRWGDLYADSHQDAEAMNIYREALERDDSHAFALLGAARVLANGFDDAANAFLQPLRKRLSPAIADRSGDHGWCQGRRIIAFRTHGARRRKSR
jgi:phytoene dehydrogenase-like protein